MKKRFEEWVHAANSPDDIFKRFSKKFELGGHKAFAICRILKKANIILVSSLSDEQVRSMFLAPAHSMQEAITLAIKEQGENSTLLFIPEASRLAVRITGQA
ncbi:MAG TPA: hypothetical protein VHQ70_10285 [Syntrophomonadaceae bacterium]|nr:hypothetical protein [Syntrophomonadaceae bacterium]